MLKRNCEKADRAYGHAQRFYQEVVLRYDGDDCLIWPFARLAAGYGRLRDPKCGRKLRSVHRMVCEETHGPPPTAAAQAAHRCGNGFGGCVNPRHIRWLSAAENLEEKKVHGTHMFGNRHPNRIISDEVAAAILSEKGTKSAAEVATQHGVKKNLVYSVWSGRRWTHVGGDGRV